MNKNKPTNSKTSLQKDVNNESNTDNSNRDRAKGNKDFLNKIEENEPNSKPSHSEDVKSQREFREGLTGQRRSQPKPSDLAKVSKTSNSLVVNNVVPDLNSPLNVVKQRLVDDQGATDTHNARTIKTSLSNNTHLRLSTASVTSHSIKREENNQTKHVGFGKEPYQPNKSSLIPPAQPMHKEPTRQNEITNVSVRKESNRKESTRKSLLIPVPNQPLNIQRQSIRPELNQEKLGKSAFVESQRAQKVNNLPSNTTLPMVQSMATFADANSTVTAAKKNIEVPAAKENPQKLIGQTISNPKLEDGFIDVLSEQTLYARVMKRLPTTGPLSINDLDDFLKKSKIDFEHFYYKKPISNIQITDFNLLKTLGVGAFGRVVLGESKADRTLYALKIIDKVGVVKRNHVRYVSNEKRILQAINFPFVISLQYFFSDLYYLYFVMPYISGGNFYRHLKIFRKVKECDAKFYIGQLVLALEYLHYLDLIHRDMKTENVMIDAFGYLKLVDFGQCVRCCGSDKTWTFTGTPDYMAPEIIIGKGYDCAVDWWALGVITFELCAGFRPFKDENSRKLQLLIMCNQYSMPNNFSRSLKKLIASMLVLEPKKRIANSIKKASFIKKHTWFKELNWLALLNRTVEAPFLPNLQKTSAYNQPH